MKIMLVCAGGCSTSILMNKMKKHASGKGIDLTIQAYGVSDFSNHLKDYEVVLLGPQIAYKKKEITQKAAPLPVDVINSMDYAMGNSENILKQAKRLSA